MKLIPTPHIEATSHDQIAKIVLMPGDPLRAKLIADTYLTNVTKFNDLRNMFGYTGYYKGVQISVMGSGMGMPSMGIYSYELYNNYNVDKIIRIGSCGAYTNAINLGDVLLVASTWSESSFSQVFTGVPMDTCYPASCLNQQLLNSANNLNIPLKTIKVHTTDVFYGQSYDSYLTKIVKSHQCDAVEMEAHALFINAQVLNKKAACILTVSDSLLTHESMNGLQRQNSFTNMMEIALESCLN